MSEPSAAECCGSLVAPLLECAVGAQHGATAPAVPTPKTATSLLRLQLLPEHDVFPNARCTRSALACDGDSLWIWFEASRRSLRLLCVKERERERERLQRLPVALLLEKRRRFLSPGDRRTCCCA